MVRPRAPRFACADHFGCESSVLVPEGLSCRKSTYKLLVNNFKNKPINVQLLDRIPVGDQSQQRSVQLGETSAPVSEDALHERMRRPRGILRWDLDIATGRQGSEAMDLNPRGMGVAMGGHETGSQTTPSILERVS